MRKLLIILALFFAFPAFGADAPAKPTLGSTNNSKEPIKVDSDTLEVYQDKQQAVFTGHVVAVQGTMTLKSDKMIVYYLTKEDQANAPKPAPKPGANGTDASGSKNAIRKVDVEGNVFLIAPDQTAKSQKGYYDLQKNFISMTGDVVLTKENNILKGNKLDYFVDTGYSKLYSEPTQTGGRVRGLFVPADSNPPGAAPAASGK